MDGKGIFRTRGTGSLPDTARVVDQSVWLDLPEAEYRRRGYSPPFDELRWIGDARPRSRGRGKGLQTES
jgi:hypothetical protein